MKDIHSNDDYDYLASLGMPVSGPISIHDNGGDDEVHTEVHMYLTSPTT